VWVSDTTGEDAPIPWEAQTMASIVLILSHPLLGYPEATVRTHFVGQSRNLWNVGGHALGTFTLRGFGLVVAGGSGVACLGRIHPDSWLGRRRGSGAACLGRNRPEILFRGAPFEATRIGSQSDRAIVPEPDMMFHLRIECAHGRSWHENREKWAL